MAKKRGPGRPKGSKNKVTKEKKVNKKAGRSASTVKKRGPGRPPGVKTKAKGKKKAGRKPGRSSKDETNSNSNGNLNKKVEKLQRKLKKVAKRYLKQRKVTMKHADMLSELFDREDRIVRKLKKLGLKVAEAA